MQEHYRALIIILVVATTFFAFAHRTACSITEAKDFTRRRNLWYGLTLAAFLANNQWLYMAVAILLLAYTNRHESNKPALFFFTLFILPVAFITIPGMGLFNYLIQISHPRILELIVLLPAFFALRKQGDNLSFGRTKPDKTLTAFLVLTTVLYLRTTTLTDTMRQAFYLFIDGFLPYYVVSRSLKNLQAFRDALSSLVLAIMILALLAGFETYKKWLLYSSVTSVLELEERTGNYLLRDGVLRAITSAGDPITLGYLMVVGIGCYLFLHRSIPYKSIRRIGMALLVAGLIAALSRGPWVGAAVLFVAFVATGRYAVRRMINLGLAAILALSLIAMLPGGNKIINLLPFVGATEKANIVYRERLITNSMIVIQRHPWFGTTDYLDTPEMQAMRQGEGIIDVVNTYIGIALQSGFVGLGFFVSFFALVLLGIYNAMRSIPDKDSEEYLLGRVLFATLLSIMVIIGTVSSITFIPIMYWSIAGLGVAYAQMAQNKHRLI